MAFMGRYLLILVFSLLTACGSKVTEENFSKVQNGMSLRQVTQILGVPVSIDSINVAGISGTSAVWKSRNTVITIQFLNDKAQIKTLGKENSPNSSNNSINTNSDSKNGNNDS